MNKFTFTKLAFEQYIYWQSEDKKTMKKINSLLQDIARNGVLSGIRKPEALKYLDGLYSRRIEKIN